MGIRNTLLLLTITAAVHGVIPTVGVMDFTSGKGIAAVEAKAVTEMFISFLAGSHVVNVVDRSVLLKAINRSGTNNSGNSSSYLQTIGRSAGVEFICIGELYVSGAKYELIVNIYSVSANNLVDVLTCSALQLENLPSSIKKTVDSIPVTTWGIRLTGMTRERMMELISKDFDGNENTIKLYASSFPLETRMYIASKTENIGILPCIGNLWPLPGFGLGSFFQGDYLGGTICVGATLATIGLMVADFLIYSFQSTSLYPWVYFGGLFFGAIRPMVYAYEFNEKVAKALDLRVSFDIKPSPGLVFKPAADIYCVSFSARF